MHHTKLPTSINIPRNTPNKPLKSETKVQRDMSSAILQCWPVLSRAVLTCKKLTFHQEVVTFSIENCELTNKRNWLNQQNLVQCWTTQNRGFINKTLGKSTMLSFQNGNVIGQIGYGSSWLVFATQSLVRCAAHCMICMICLICMMPPRS